MSDVQANDFIAPVIHQLGATCCIFSLFVLMWGNTEHCGCAEVYIVLILLTVCCAQELEKLVSDEQSVQETNMKQRLDGGASAWAKLGTLSGEVANSAMEVTQVSSPRQIPKL